MVDDTLDMTHRHAELAAANPDPAVRADFVRGLLRIGEGEAFAVHRLVREERHPDVLEALANRQDLPVEDAVVLHQRLCQGAAVFGEDVVRDAFAGSLKSAEQRAVQIRGAFANHPVVELWSVAHDLAVHPNPLVRYRTAASVPDGFWGLFAYDTDERVRGAVCEALRQAPGEEALSAVLVESARRNTPLPADVARVVDQKLSLMEPKAARELQGWSFAVGQRGGFALHTSFDLPVRHVAPRFQALAISARAGRASNSRSPANLLDLAQDPSLFVRATAACNHHLPVQAQALLARDEEIQVRMNVSMNPALRPEVQALFHDDSHRFLRIDCVSTALSKEQYSRLLADPEPMVRRAAVLDGPCSPADLALALTDPVFVVRDAAEQRVIHLSAHEKLEVEVMRSDLSEGRVDWIATTKDASPFDLLAAQAAATSDVAQLEPFLSDSVATVRLAALVNPALPPDRAVAGLDDLARELPEKVIVARADPALQARLAYDGAPRFHRALAGTLTKGGEGGRALLAALECESEVRHCVAPPAIYGAMDVLRSSLSAHELMEVHLQAEVFVASRKARCAAEVEDACAAEIGWAGTPRAAAAAAPCREEEAGAATQRVFAFAGQNRPTLPLRQEALGDAPALDPRQLSLLDVCAAQALAAPDRDRRPPGEEVALALVVASASVAPGPIHNVDRAEKVLGLAPTHEADRNKGMSR